MIYSKKFTKTRKRLEKCANALDGAEEIEEHNVFLIVNTLSIAMKCGGGGLEVIDEIAFAVATIGARSIDKLSGD